MASEHPLVGVAARALGDLDDERRLDVDAAAEQAHRLLGVVDVVGADGVLAVGDLEQLRGRDDHKRRTSTQEGTGRKCGVATEVVAGDCGCRVAGNGLAADLVHLPPAALLHEGDVELLFAHLAAREDHVGLGVRAVHHDFAHGHV